MSEDKFITIRIETEIRAALLELAATDRRSCPLEIRWLVEKEIQRRAEEKKQ